MSTTLSRTGLVLPAGAENLDLTVVNNNTTKIDGWVGVFFCTSSTRPSTPFTGQLIFETDTRLFSVYDGSAWIQFLAAGGSAVHEVEYYAAATQSIPNNVDTPLAFDTAVQTSSDVTRGTSTGGSIANAKFTLNRGGLWAVDAQYRLTGITSAASFGIWIGVDNSTSFRLGEQTINSGGTANIALSATFVRRFGATTALNVYAWHNSGASRTTDLLGQGTHIRLAWLRPL